MRFIGITLILLLLPMLISAGFCTSQPIVPGEILVKFKPGTPSSEIASIHRQNGSVMRGSIPKLGIQIVSSPKGREINHAAKYKTNRFVEYAEPNYLAQATSLNPNDPYFTTNQWTLFKIKAPAAWEMNVGESSVIVAVLDTGVDYKHPDLEGKIINGYDFVNRDSDAMDDNGHGTAVAGIIGACANNGIGVAGITWACKIMAIKVADATGYASYSNIASGITYATDYGARVINISIAGASPSSTLQSAVDYAYKRGCLVIASSGNNGTNTVYYPAACSNAVAVGATDQYDQVASFSNYGSALDFVSPCNAYTTLRGGGYGGFGGTSGSAPHVAGVAALIISANPTFNCAQVYELLKSGAEDLGTVGWDEKSGWGRINAYNSLSTVTAPLQDTSPPTVAIISPAAGSTISGTVTVSANAVDNSGVAKVEFFVDGVSKAVTWGPFTWNWNTTSIANGLHTIGAKAYDIAGNATSHAINVNVSNSLSSTVVFSGSVSTKVSKLHLWTANSTTDIKASLSWSGTAGLKLQLYDAQNTLIASSTSNTSPATLCVTGLPVGEYKFKVSAESGKTTKYTLTVTSTPH